MVSAHEAKTIYIFALPGNPVSVTICFHKYILPQLNKCLGLSVRRPEFVRLTHDFTFKKNLLYRLPVKTEIDEQGVLNGTPSFFNGSGDFASLAQTDGFVELPASKQDFPTGSVHRFFRWVM